MHEEFARRIGQRGFKVVGRETDNGANVIRFQRAIRIGGKGGNKNDVMERQRGIVAAVGKRYAQHGATCELEGHMPLSPNEGRITKSAREARRRKLLVIGTATFPNGKT